MFIISVTLLSRYKGEGGRMLHLMARESAEVDVILDSIFSPDRVVRFDKYLYVPVT